MNKIKLNSKSFNLLKRNVNGPRTQRHWSVNFIGLGVDVGLKTKSIIYRYKSPTTKSFRIIVIQRFNINQKIDNNIISIVILKYYDLLNSVLDEIDPIDKKTTNPRQVFLSLNNAWDKYSISDKFNNLSDRTKEGYIFNYNKHVVNSFISRVDVKKLNHHDIIKLFDKLKDGPRHQINAILRNIQNMLFDMKIIEVPFIFNVRN